MSVLAFEERRDCALKRKTKPRIIEDAMIFIYENHCLFGTVRRKQRTICNVTGFVLGLLHQLTVAAKESRHKAIRSKD